MIHQESLRTGRPFVLINCAAIRVALLESELFGYVDGSFPYVKNGRSERYASQHGEVQTFVVDGAVLHMYRVGCRVFGQVASRSQ
ncbi:sigma 54-interacting transcriptional regulator [Geobacillus vulcani]|uniref:sigma 54-interacting transcriptional regulator n=1 Tax=Geobacillus vulcani TaxID=135517 RepID=UPI0004DF1EFA